MSVFTEFPDPILPVIPGNRAVITDFGAISGGEVLCTEAVKKGIEYLSSLGGGTLVFPKGTWLTGAIHLKDNICLHFEDGSRLNFTPEKQAYLPVVFTSFEGIRCYNYSPLIYAIDVKNIAVTGKGVLNGNGQYWWDWKQIDTGVIDLYTKGEQGADLNDRVYGTPEFGLRPCMIQFARCENVLIEGIRLENTPFWTVHPVWCKSVTIRGLELENPFESPNSDSINVESCDRVLVEDCVVLEGGDDIFTLKSGRDKDGRDVGIPCQNVIIRNCEAKYVRGGGVVIGSEMSGGVKNVLVDNCRFGNIMNGIKIKSCPGRGAYVKNIEYRNLSFEKVSYGVYITLRYACVCDPGVNLTTLLPDISDIYAENVNGIIAEQYGVLIEGEQNCHIKNICLKEINIESAATGMRCECVDNLKMKNINIG